MIKKNIPLDNHKEQARDAIQTLITYVAGLEHFDRKMEVINALYNVEWSLSKPKVEDVVNDLPEELQGGHESGWSE